MPRYTEGRFEENFPGSDYSDEEREFFAAVDAYKRRHNRPHPTWHEILRFVKQLGYRKVSDAPPPEAA